MEGHFSLDSHHIVDLVRSKMVVPETDQGNAERRLTKLVVDADGSLSLATDAFAEEELRMSKMKKTDVSRLSPHAAAITCYNPPRHITHCL